jgi:hypothetical protein
MFDLSDFERGNEPQDAACLKGHGSVSTATSLRGEVDVASSDTTDGSEPGP